MPQLPAIENLGAPSVPLLLRTSRDLPPADSYDHWLAVTDTPTEGVDTAAKLPGLARLLEQTFEAERDTWWRLARHLAKTPSAELSHMVACGSFGSDFGLMLAWDRLACQLAAGSQTILMLCDDPWAFRQMAGHAGVIAGAAPRLAATQWKLRLRGLAARGMLALKLVKSVRRTQRQRDAMAVGDHALLVYGHPASRADGFDAYFGTMMRELPQLKRVLHTDCPPDRAAELAEDGRTVSLHGWGSALFAVTMPLWFWRPRASDLKGEYGWLIRRTIARENSGGGPAMNAWQNHCQRRFLADRRPAALCWPWENHPWERNLCRAARRLQLTTIGYQHTVVGPHQINYSPRANVDGAASLPDVVVANGPAYGAELAAWDVPAERIVIGGAWRLAALKGVAYDPDAPVFVPLSAIRPIANLQVEAARRIAQSGRPVLVKEHPMYPLAFTDEPNLSRSEIPLPQQARLSAVVFSTGTSGLEGLLLGLPTLRLMAEDRLAIDVLPAGVAVDAITLDELPAALDRAKPRPPLPFEQVLAAVDMAVWRRLLS